MKKLNIIIAMGLMALGLTACQDRDWDKEIADYTIGNEKITEHNVVTIKDLKETYKKAILGQGMQYSNNAVQLIEDDIQIKGVVISNDRGGNTSQQIILTDQSGENIQVSIADNDIMTYLPVGQEIIVDLKDLYIGGYSDNPVIGYPNEKYAATVDKNGNAVGSQIYRMSFMSRFLWYKHFKTIGEPDLSRVPEAIELTNDLYDAELTHVCKLIYVDGKFASCDGETKIADPVKVESTDTGNGVNETFNGTKCTKSIIVRTSTYADFSASLIPAANVRLFGIMTRDTYKTGYQIQLRDADDITIHCAGCDKYVGSTKWTRNEDGDYVCNECKTIVKKIK